jgi:predicted CoA-binding protein
MSNFAAEFPKYRKWAVVGVSEDRAKYGNKIYRDMRDAGYIVYAVNPKLESVEGDLCYPSVKALPEVPDVVDLVIPPATALRVVEDCLEAGVRRLWFQPGSESGEAVKKAQDSGMEVVYDACIMIRKQAWV